MAEYNYYYYLGAFQEAQDIDGVTRVAPQSTVGLIDLSHTDRNNLAFFATTEELGAGYVLLLHGDIVKDVVDSKVNKAWETATGYLPQGNIVLDMLYECLTVGSDPYGITAVKPLMPTSKLDLEIHLGGHSLIKTEKFDIATSPHKDKVISVLQKSYASIKTDCSKTGSKKYLQVLDFMGEKYKVSNPEDYFIPKNLPKELPIKHETVITESFNTADSTTLGPDLTWTETQGGMSVVSNSVRSTNAAASSLSRAEHDLSSSDNYCKADFVFPASPAGGFVSRVFCRMSSSENTCYAVRRYGVPVSAFSHRIEKVIAATSTQLATPSSLARSDAEEWKIEANGSTIKSYLGGVEKHSVTDTAISSGVRSGIGTYADLELDKVITYTDNFEAGDLGAEPPPASQFMTCMKGYW